MDLWSVERSELTDTERGLFFRKDTKRFMERDAGVKMKREERFTISPLRTQLSFFLSFFWSTQLSLTVSSGIRLVSDPYNSRRTSIVSISSSVNMNPIAPSIFFSSCLVSSAILATEFVFLVPAALMVKVLQLCLDRLKYEIFCLFVNFGMIDQLVELNYAFSSKQCFFNWVNAVQLKP